MIKEQTYSKIWIIFFIISLALWIGWAFHCSQNTAPGLLDDGSHMVFSENYPQKGWFNMVWQDIVDTYHGARFYEVQYSLLGAYNVFFGKNLDFWYLGNFLLCFLTGLFIFYIVHFFTKDYPAAIIACLVFLTSSPIAETVRANFGKVEDAMVFFYFLGIAAWIAYLSVKNSFLKWPFLFAAIFGLSTAAVSKESGKIIMMSPIIAAGVILFTRETRQEKTKWASLGAIAGFGILLNYLISKPSSDALYLKKYFSLNFDPSFLFLTLKYYIGQVPDVIVLSLLLLFIFLPIQKKLSPREKGFYLGFAGVAFLYEFLLLTFRFYTSYYVYVPMALLAVPLGIAFSVKNRWLQLAVVGIVLLTRYHSIPYNYVIAEAQAFFDKTNLDAMEMANSFGAEKVRVLPRLAHRNVRKLLEDNEKQLYKRNAHF